LRICRNEVKILPEAMPCIRCGACAETCPVQFIAATVVLVSLKPKKSRQLHAQHLFECIDCGCCAYVCPSHIPLVDYFRFAKAEIRAADREKQLRRSGTPTL
jgi:Na+-translocating ferredoxin:NAD+ oxidoreductase subunit C